MSGYAFWLTRPTALVSLVGQEALPGCRFIPANRCAHLMAPAGTRLRPSPET